MSDVMFDDRQDAGRRLAALLVERGLGEGGRSEGARGLGDGGRVVVLGLPRGGVPVAAEVAAALRAPLDVIVVRKLGFPFHPEMAMGAIGEGGVRVLDEQLVARFGVSREEVAAVERAEAATLADRVARFRGDRPRLDLTGRTAVIVDDGIATGATASAAAHVARALGAARVVVAAPVGAPDAVRRVEGADEVVCVEQPEDFAAVGAHYRTFGQTPDEEVAEILARTRRAEVPR